MPRPRKYLIGVAALLVLLLAARAALPYFVQDYVNRRLSALHGYQGRIGDVDLSLLRGAYRIEGIRIEKNGAGEPLPFFSCEHVDFSVEWRNLLRGALVAQGQFFAPQLNLVQAQTERESQLGTEENWADRLQELFAFRLNTVRIHDGTVRFRAPGIRAQDALVARHISGIVSNLTNIAPVGAETFARYRFEAEVLQGGRARVAGSVDPLARQPTFDINLSVRQVQLPQLNPWLRRFIKADAESGQFELFVELAAADGAFKGYAKPVMRNVNIYGTAEREPNPLRRLWEGVIEFAANLFENEPRQQLAARVPFSGTIHEPQAGILATIVSVARNAFVSAFARSLEGSISVRQVRKSLEDLGGTDDNKQEAKDEQI